MWNQKRTEARIYTYNTVQIVVSIYVRRYFTVHTLYALRAELNNKYRR